MSKKSVKNGSDQPVLPDQPKQEGTEYSLPSLDEVAATLARIEKAAEDALEAADAVCKEKKEEIRSRRNKARRELKVLQKVCQAVNGVTVPGLGPLDDPEPDPDPPEENSEKGA